METPVKDGKTIVFTVTSNASDEKLTLFVSIQDGVSITEDLLPIGKCFYCGYENEHYVCELCGTVYDDMGGDEHLCNGCMPRDD